MRLTIHLDDDLMRAVQRLALETGTTVTSVITESLRERLQRHRHRTSNPPAPLSLVTTGEGGLRPGVHLDDSATLFELMEDGG
ncbi:ribbon-helix-helix domain-containing protein [Candidatus Palauibacter sp.]|uniref:ribbon-helix-helix domain-containing protein n=1 Tax=Candidatus Palauibacter sp. TaxID=3101350 RepID=UPI003D0FD16D